MSHSLGARGTTKLPPYPKERRHPSMTNDYRDFLIDPARLDGNGRHHQEEAPVSSSSVPLPSMVLSWSKVRSSYGDISSLEKKGRRTQWRRQNEKVGVRSTQSAVESPHQHGDEHEKQARSCGCCRWKHDPSAFKVCYGHMMPHRLSVHTQNRLKDWEEKEKQGGTNRLRFERLPITAKDKAVFPHVFHDFEV